MRVIIKIDTSTFLAVHEPESAQYPPEQHPVEHALASSALAPQSKPLHRLSSPVGRHPAGVRGSS